MRINVFVLLLFILFFTFGCVVKNNELIKKKYEETSEVIDLTSPFNDDAEKAIASVGSTRTQGVVKTEENKDSQKHTKKNNIINKNYISSNGIKLKSKLGKCYSKMYIPAVYKNKKLRVIKEKASYRFEVVGPVYKWEEKRILVKEPEEKIEIIPAKYEWVKDTTLINQVEGAKNKIKVMVESPKIVKHKVNAEYRLIKVRRTVVPSKVKRIEIPAVYDTQLVPYKIKDKYYDWRQVLCAMQITTDIVTKLQNSLYKAKYYKGVIDGVFGTQTQKAIQAYQRDKNLAVGQITIETLRSLGIKEY